MFVSAFWQTKHNNRGNSFCAFVLLLNLVFPEWVKVNCSQPQLKDVFCVLPLSQPDQLPLELMKGMEVYSNECVKLNGTCYVFIWKAKYDIISNIHLKSGANYNIRDFIFLFKSIAGPFCQCLFHVTWCMYFP